MKKVINFDVAYNADTPPMYGFSVTGVDTVQVEFDWDEKDPAFKVALDELDKQMDKDYMVQYWWWVQ